MLKVTYARQHRRRSLVSTNVILVVKTIILV